LGLGGTAGALAVIGIFILILWVVVWIVSRLPAFGNVDLKLALRNMTSRRWRTATTLLALLAGMYALSSITFISQSVRDVIAFNFTNRLGGNVLVFPLTTVFLSPDLAEPFINQRIDGLEGVQSRTRNDVYTLDIEEINGEAIEFETFAFTDETGEEQTFTDATVGAIAQRTTNTNLERGDLIAGRQLTPDDDGEARIVLNSSAIADGAVVPEIGDILTVETNGRDRVRYEVEVVGVLAPSDGPEADAFVPIGFIEQRPDVSFTTIQVDDASLDNVLIELSSLPTVFVLDISYIDNLIQQLIGQFSAIPTVVGLLALLAAAAIMANTVLLATLERRKQIGVMKAMGLKGRRVLGVLLLENTIIALLGAGIGIGLSALNSSLLSFIGIGNVVAIPPNALPFAIGLVFAAVLIAWVATIASARVITRESVTTVLRYD
ncbi:MAG: ABC transporter permease, partial [Chloroflexota bacterium]